MTITFKKINELPEGIHKLTDNFMILETPQDDKVQLDLVFPAKNVEGTYYDFIVIPDERYGSLTGIMQEIMKGLYSNEIQLEDADVNDIMRAATIASGELAADGRDYQKQEEDNSNKIFYHLINGQIMFSDATQMNWDENIKNMGNTISAADSVRQLIALLESREEVEIKSSEEETTGEMKSTIELAKAEIAKFHEVHKLDIDYKVFEEAGIATERELLVLKLIDILEVYQQLITATALVTNQQQLINMYEQRIRELINTTSKDADEMTPVNVEEMTSDKTE